MKKNNSISEMCRQLNSIFLHEASQIRDDFNKAVKYSTRYIGGEKLVPIEQVVPLKLGYRKSQKYVPYEDALSKFMKKYY